MKDLKVGLGKRIRSLRKSTGLSQEKLGEKASLSYKFLGELERGQVNVSLDSLEKIATALKVEITDLFSEDNILLLKAVNNKKALLSEKEIHKIKEAIKLLSKVF